MCGHILGSVIVLFLISFIVDLVYKSIYMPDPGIYLINITVDNIFNQMNTSLFGFDTHLVFESLN